MVTTVQAPFVLVDLEVVEVPMETQAAAAEAAVILEVQVDGIITALVMAVEAVLITPVQIKVTPVV